MMWLEGPRWLVVSRGADEDAVRKARCLQMALHRWASGVQRAGEEGKLNAPRFVVG